MNIVFTSDLSGLGGGEVSLLYIMEELINKGNNVGLLCRYNGELVKKASELGVTVWVCNYKRNFLKLIKLILKIKKSFGIEIVHSNELTTGILFGMLSSIFKYNNVATCHGQWYKLSKMKRFLINKYVKHIYCVSNSVKNNLEKQNIKKLSVSYLGVPKKKFLVKDNMKLDLKKELNIKDEIIILTIARYQKIKGQLKGVKTIQRLLNKGYNIKYFLVGDNIFHNEEDELYKKDVFEYIKNNKLDKNIVVLGERKDIPRLLSIADIVLITSDNESFGVVAVETLAANRIVLSTPCDGILEILDNDNDMISNENSVESLECLLERTLKDEKLRNCIKNKLPQYAKKFEVEAVVGEYLKYYTNTKNI